MRQGAAMSPLGGGTIGLGLGFHSIVFDIICYGQGTAASQQEWFEPLIIRGLSVWRLHFLSLWFLSPFAALLQQALGGPFSASDQTRSIIKLIIKVCF